MMIIIYAYRWLEEGKYISLLVFIVLLSSYILFIFNLSYPEHEEYCCLLYRLYIS